MKTVLVSLVGVVAVCGIAMLLQRRTKQASPDITRKSK